MRTLVKCFWIFIIGSFIGCIIEEIWCFIRNKCFKIRRSLIYSPLIPIYGFAALFIILIAEKVGYNFWQVFLLGFIIGTFVEYVFSYVQEKVFHTKSWDYSEFMFNLNGRVNLIYSVGFGLISVLVVKPIRYFSMLIDGSTNMNLLYILSLIAGVIFLLDVIISSLACYRQRKRKEGVKAQNKIEEELDKRYNDERLDEIYNNSVYVG